MGKDIKKIDQYALPKAEEENCQEVLRSWHGFVAELRECDDEDFLFNLLVYEAKTKQRPPFLDRIRSRYNRVRAYRELKELEAIIGKVVNVNFV